MRTISIFCCLQLIAASVVGAAIRVPHDAPTIQEGINAAMDGDTVLVFPGTYYENINFSGKKIVVASLYAIDLNPRHVENTIINGSKPSNPDTASCVLIVSGEDSTAVLQGFTLTKGKGTVWRDVHLNANYREGGGILIENSSPVIKNNFIISNRATNTDNVVSAGGGGIRCGDSNPTIVNNVIKMNRGNYGGGIVMNFSTGKIVNNIITQNGGGYDYGGGGIWAYEVGPVEVYNNTIVGNSSSNPRTGGTMASGRGGAMLVWDTEIILKNNIIWDNNQSRGEVLALEGSGKITASYNVIEGGYAGEGNMDVDPQINPTTFMPATTSPCIDAGDPSTIFADIGSTPDLADFPALGSRRNDVGAYGGPFAENMLGLLTHVTTAVKQLALFSLNQNYPNPFNSRTTISYYLPKQGFVSLKVYDLSGRWVRTAVREYQGPGSHRAIFDADNLPSGVYIYQLKFDGSFKSKRFLLVK